jgi:hypothetical protein
MIGNKLERSRANVGAKGGSAPARLSSRFCVLDYIEFSDAAIKFSSKSGLWILGGLALAQLAIKLDLEIAK